jgi:hypothetical protein
VSDEPGRPDIFVERWPLDGRKRRATLAGGARPRWRRDGRAIFFLRDGTLMQTTVEERAGDVVFGSTTRVVPLEGARDYEPAHRDDRILAIVPTARAGTATAGLIVDW